jgi:alpha-tubulin suppressor-like RCC1 family protein
VLDRAGLYHVFILVVLFCVGCSLFHDTQSVSLKAEGACEAVDCGQWMCGSSRSECGILDCGSCTNGLHCDSVEHTCTSETCEPESDHELCARLQIECGSLDVPDNCGIARAGVVCGDCAEGTCTGPPEYRCSCAPLDREQVCTDGVCGEVKNGCGEEREDCGGCSSSTAQCVNNTCCVPAGLSEDVICADLDRECGSLAVPNSCEPNREVDCGACADRTICTDGACCEEQSCLASVSDYCTSPIQKSCGQGVLDCNAGCTFSVSAGVDYGCAVAGSGELRCWGDNTFSQLGFPLTSSETTFTAEPNLVKDVPAVSLVATGAGHTCAASGDGAGGLAIWCWGRNSTGELGRTGQVAAPAAIVSDILVGGATDLSVGNHHSCIVLEGSLFCWGSNASGQLGVSGTNLSSSPVQVTSLSGVVSVDAGGAHTCVRLEEGTVHCWGANDKGQLGLNIGMGSEGHPAITLPFGSSLHIVAGEEFTCASDEQEIYCWGSNEFGQLGVSPSSVVWSATPRKIPFGFRCERDGLIGADRQAPCITDIAAGSHHVCFVDTLGAVYCWGRLATGPETSQIETTPKLVQGLTGLIRSISCGDGFSCAVSKKDRLQCWGNTKSGKLGRNDLQSSGPADVDFWP